MADGVAITAGAGTTIATDDIAGIHFQRVKATWGVDGTATDVSATAPLPVAPTPAAAVGSAKVTIPTAGTRVQLDNNACGSVVVKAGLTNTGLLYLGGAAVAAANGLELSPGESAAMDVANTNLLYLDTATNGNTATYLWTT